MRTKQCCQAPHVSIIGLLWSMMQIRTQTGSYDARNVGRAACNSRLPVGNSLLWPHSVFVVNYRLVFHCRDV